MISGQIEKFAELMSVAPNVLVVVIAIFIALTCGTLIRLAYFYTNKDKLDRKYLQSLETWWILAVVIALVIALPPLAGLVFWVAISFAAMSEYERAVKSRGTAFPFKLVYTVFSIHYLFVFWHSYEALWLFIPALYCLSLLVRFLTAGRIHGYTTPLTGAMWGLLPIVFLFSHTALFHTLPPEINPEAGNAGWLIFLLILTEMNDISQALWGRQFGRHKLAPLVSPNKTWEGFLGGVITTVLLAVLLAPLLTPLADFPWRISGIPVWLRSSILPVVAGLMISVGGLLGDLNMSAVKRKLGIKDFGTLIPGQGGILDRIDSLTLTAPLLFYFVYFLFV